MSGRDDFDWNDDEAIVLEPRLGVAVYLNQKGDVVIRQQGSYPDDDVWVVFPATDAEIVARRIVDVVREAEAWKRTANIQDQDRATNGHGTEKVPELPLLADRGGQAPLNGAS